MSSPLRPGRFNRAAYRQIFFHAFKWNRKPFLESPITQWTIIGAGFHSWFTVIENLLVELLREKQQLSLCRTGSTKSSRCNVDSEREKIAWSIVVATKGIQGFARLTSQQ
jgi:phycobilisome rod-core linker protein